MNKKSNISPIGLKGHEINDRMKQLMGVTPINEGVSRSAVELTKMGPDGVAYAIIRENREWYIKRANKTSNLIVEDFQYIGGLKNKKEAAYPSYSSALKKLNLMFRSLAEAYNFEGEINITVNDNLLTESYNDVVEEEQEEVEETPIEEEIEMTEDEKAIDKMIGESDGVDHETFDTSNTLEGGKEKVTESRMSIFSAMENMDELVENLTVKKKV